jgi:hypothetical protein
MRRTALLLAVALLLSACGAGAQNAARTQAAPSSITPRSGDAPLPAYTIENGSFARETWQTEVMSHHLGSTVPPRASAVRGSFVPVVPLETDLTAQGA